MLSERFLPQDRLKTFRHCHFAITFDSLSDLSTYKARATGEGEPQPHVLERNYAKWKAGPHTEGPAICDFGVGRAGWTSSFSGYLGDGVKRACLTGIN